MESSDPMFELMQSYLDIPGMLAAMLVSDQGLVINSAQADAVDIDTLSALLVDIVATGQRFGEEAGVGGLETMTVEFDSLTLLLAPFQQDVMLALVGRPGTFALK
jgi:predicted regulator of Ras-like GTPase activity (Roadblock/LC7/MglB family)